MLTRLENFSITLIPHFFSRRGHVLCSVGKRVYEWKNWRLTRDEFDNFLAESQFTPYRFDLDGKTYWLYDYRLYRDNEDLTSDEVKALLITREKQQRARIERAKAIAASPRALQSFSGSRSRTAIPDDVKLLVWERDQGRCVKCGSNLELQYDHVIPVSFGGAGTPENLQILCGRCNRTKSNSIV